MRVKIYQSFFDPKQYRNLDKAFIPFNNVDNTNPELREYPLLKKLHEKHVNYTGHWGMLSWRWKQKTGLDGKELIKWIDENPNHDVYMINPHVHLPEMFRNSFTQGDIDHPGMLKFTNKLVQHLGYNFNIEHADFPLDIFSTCHFYIGNSKFWDKWISFADTTIAIANKDKEMYDYLYIEKSAYQGSDLINFCFLIERLVSLFLYLNYAQYKVIHYPYQYFLKRDNKELEFTQIKEKALLLRENTIY